MYEVLKRKPWQVEETMHVLVILVVPPPSSPSSRLKVYLSKSSTIIPLPSPVVKLEYLIK